MNVATGSLIISKNDYQFEQLLGKEQRYFINVAINSV